MAPAVSSFPTGRNWHVVFLISALFPLSAETAITYTLHLSGVDSGIATQITNAMAAAVSLYNDNGQFTKSLNVYYNSGVPTANANWAGTINFGGTRNTRVAMHEIGHTLGIGTHWKYASLMTSGTWDGPVANALRAEFDGSGTMLGDSVHMWPYGLNYDSEDGTRNRVRHVMMMQAMQCDMDLGPCDVDRLVGTHRRIVGRASSKVMDAGGNSDGSTVQLYGDWGGSNQRWSVISHGDGIYSFRSMQSDNRALDVYNWGTTSGTDIVIWPYSGQNVQRFYVDDYADGWFRIRPVIATSMCLAADGTGNNANVETATCSTSTSQQWKLIP
ncbi:hypothetical protein DIPPA_29045 [Diplonema papillatum]|nr:hypothetical protein DIPPA_29045 [Diplonema papillatum]